MKSAFIIILALSTSLSPIAASAQPGREHRRELTEDRKDARRDGVISQQEQRELNRDRAEVRESRRELRYDRQRQETWRDRAEWRTYRGQRSGYWYAPGLRVPDQSQRAQLA